ncbi:MAG: sigma factor-like helix-turn-helix DNA-binding protein [Actinomycetota bacterium]
MERDKALGELPTAYAVAIRMREGGTPDAEIAKVLDVPVESVGRLVQIGEQKLRALLHDEHRQVQ